jgi:hypothetical protein
MTLLERADRVESFAVDVPAGTTRAAPLSQALTFRQGEVLRLELIIPDGHRALTGFALAYAGQRVVPATNGAWIVGNDDTLDWPLEGLPTGGRWVAQAYNDGTFAHTFYVRFHVNELDLGAPAGPRLVAPLPL